jgi:hypothetical protein
MWMQSGQGIAAVNPQRGLVCAKVIGVKADSPVPLPALLAGA